MKTEGYKLCRGELVVIIFALTTVCTLDAQVVLIGDSTVADVREPLYGWGEFLPDFIDQEVSNFANSGQSSRSFYNEYWPNVLSQLQPDDTLLVQFGHNDLDNPNPDKHTTTPEFRSFLNDYITEATAVGVNPILVTPPESWTYSDGNFFTQRVGLATAVRAVATENGIPAIDLNTFTIEYFGGADPESIISQFEAIPNDRTHPSAAGARVWAEFVGGELNELLANSTSPTTTDPIFGDFDNSGVVDLVDIDLLTVAIVAAEDLAFDLNMDGTLDTTDLNFFLDTTGNTKADGNLDGSVDFADFLIVSANFGRVGDTSWSVGDFNADDIVNFPDFLILSRNFQQQQSELTTTSRASAATMSVVPEPANLALTLYCLVPLIRRQALARRAAAKKISR